MTIQQVLLAGGWTPTYATWNSADKSPDVTLSGGNLTIDSASASNEGVRATIGKSSGKWYWEVTIVDRDFGYVGVAAASETLDNRYIGQGANGWSYRSDAVKLNNASATAYGATFVDGDVIGVALDLDAGSIVFYKNGVSQGTAFTGLSGTLYPANSIGAGTSAQHTANFGASAFSYTPPVGYGPLYS